MYFIKCPLITSNLVQMYLPSWSQMSKFFGRCNLLTHWQWLVAWSAPSHCLNQCWDIVNLTLRNKLQWNINQSAKLFIHQNVFENVICEIASVLSRGRWVNSLGPSDVIWRQGSGSTLAQVMTCCLMAPSHYLNQCWLIISKVLWHSSEGNFIRDASAPFTKVSLKITFLELNWNLPGVNELKECWIS